MRDKDRYLERTGEWFYYIRRVPKKLALIDRRGKIKLSLKTDSLCEARQKRDELEQADNDYWRSLKRDPDDAALLRYRSAVERARVSGVKYKTAGELASNNNAGEVIRRVEMLSSGRDRLKAEAVLGGFERPKTSLSRAFKIYVKEIVASELTEKSPAQLNGWKKNKLRAINNFNEIIGEMAIEDITRDHARQFYRWWLNRIVPPKGSNKKPLSAAAGNRGLGNLRLLYVKFFEHMGEEDRANPFRKLIFSNKQATKRKAFTVKWIEETILKPRTLDHLNVQARLITYTLIETGARPSEICNLAPDNIRLDEPVPYIAIRSRPGREIKTDSSERDIPLLGVSKAAMRLAQNGFPRYRDKEGSLSALLSKVFRSNGLFPTRQHFIYSFRHSFEKRMAEAGLDYGLRCLLMGHATKRPVYGDGGSLKYRAEELAKITLNYNPVLFKGLASI